MVQATYTPDMFNEKTGKLTVTFDIFQPVTQTVNSIEAGQVRRFIEQYVRNCLTFQADAMLNQRNANYAHVEGHFSETTLKALNKLPYMIDQCRHEKDMKDYAVKFSLRVIPLLQDIQPAPTSKFYTNFTLKLEKMEKVIDQLIQNPDVLASEKSVENPDFSVLV